MHKLKFSRRFAPLILGGAKVTTIRKNDFPVGAKARLYSDEHQELVYLCSVEIVACRPITLGRKDNGGASMSVGKRVLAVAEMTAIANSDGFHTAAEMVQWFETTYQVPANHSGCAHDVFAGFLIAWGPL